MTIGVEATALTRAARTGVDNYTHHLVTAMASTRSAACFELAYFWSFTKPAPNIGIPLPNVAERKNRLLPPKAYRALYRLRLAPPLDLFTGARADFFLFPNFVRWPLAFCAYSAVVIYDLSFLRSTENLTKRLRTFLTRKVPRSISACDFVVTISETVRNELLEEYHIDPARVVVVPPAIDHRVFYPRAEAQCYELLKEHRLSWRSYILFVGTIEPRKNLEGILRAYAGLAPESRRSTPLVLAGGKGWKDEAIYQTYAELTGQGLDIRMLGYVSAEVLPCLYSAASAFVFPSTYEGFGMPLLEAMACGAPCVTSSRSSMPEVAGDAALLVNPEDTTDITRAIERLLRDEDLNSRLRLAGIRRSQLFSWEASASVLWNAIDSQLSTGED